MKKYVKSFVNDRMENETKKIILAKNLWSNCEMQ